ncbi:MAG: undecaprenyl/decaprenyl-phosphate alpha-N-acetylglucosaminyl 1-phosphate transferase [Acidobacteria bacterium]|nr:undecaprenyl/decaprenyl-phosphate alpha-N-acetylglucosaminyl 1-phosphate transferase [Acidobacteriota bacterium]
MYSLITLAFSSFLLALVLTPLIRDFSVRRGWVDTPDQRRKMHRSPIPRTGGAAVVLAYLGAYGVLLAIGFRGGSLVDLQMVARMAPAVLVILAVGLYDDLYGLTAWKKLAGQLIAAGVAFASGVQMHGIAGWVFPGWAELPATLIWMVMVTNAVNLIDGMDGLATGVTLFATLTIVTSGLQANNIALCMAVIPLAGALLGFLRYNFNPATIFLGDCGSLTIGFLLACIGIFWSQKSVTILGVTAPLLALAIPLLDSGLAVMRRFLRRQSIFDADRGHVHHRLLDRGLSVRQAALLLYGVSLVFAILSLVSSVVRDSYAGVILVLFGAVTWIGIQSLGYVEINMAGRLLLGGGFRRALVCQLIIRNFDESLRLAADSNAVWIAVRDTAREIGFHQIDMQLNGEQFCVRLAAGSICPEWTAEVPLPDGDYVRLTRPFAVETHQAAMGPFLDALRKGLLDAKLHVPGVRKAAAGGV